MGTGREGVKDKTECIRKRDHDTMGLVLRLDDLIRC